MGVLVEICCGSVEDVIQAEKGGAHRVELCSALALGGLTPSAATIIEAKRHTKLPVMVMIRPRSGGFCYSEVEFSTMEREMEIAAELGADGFVFGVLTPEGQVDVRRTKRLADHAHGLPIVFHRAFDVTPDPFEALDQIMDIGMTRLLTSGQVPKSLDGASLIRSLIQRSGGRIEVMVGGGVRIGNVAEVVQQIGCRQIHLSAHSQHIDTSTYANRAISFGASLSAPEDHVSVVDYSVVAAIMQVARHI